MNEKLPLGNSNQSFVVEVKSQENNTWQGNILWVEGRKREYFRSLLELIRLIDSTLACESGKNRE